MTGYNNYFSETLSLDIEEGEIEEHVEGDTGRYMPCVAERITPFTVKTLRDIVMSELHKNLNITFKLSEHLSTKNFTLSRWLIKNLPIPTVLKQELQDLYLTCPRHRGAYFTSHSNCRSRIQVYIKPHSTLHKLLTDQQILTPTELDSYFYKVSLWSHLRSNWSEETILTLLPEIRASLGKRRNYQ